MLAEILTNIQTVGFFVDDRSTSLCFIKLLIQTMEDTTQQNVM